MLTLSECNVFTGLILAIVSQVTAKTSALIPNVTDSPIQLQSTATAANYSGTSINETQNGTTAVVYIYEDEADIDQAYRNWMDTVVSRRWEDKYNVAFHVGIIPALAAVAFCGNILVLIVASISRQFRTVSCIYLTNLSAIDAFQSVVIVPFQVLEKFVIKFPFDFKYAFIICKFSYVMREALYICYVQTFILIAIERYIVVVHPMKAMHLCTKTRARRSILAIWTIALVLAIPTWFQISLIGAEAGWPVCTRDIIRRNYPNTDVMLWRQLHESYSLFLLYVLPLAALIICYSIVAVALHRSIRASKQLTNATSIKALRVGKTPSNQTNETNQSQVKTSSDIQRERMLVLRMCVVLVTLFAVCQGPYRIQYWINVVNSSAIPGQLNVKLTAPFFALALLNSALNPVIYGFMSRNFRQAFVVVIAKWCMVPIEVYHRSVLRWQVSKESRRKKRDNDSNRRHGAATVSGTSDIDHQAKYSDNRDRRKSSSDQLISSTIWSTKDSTITKHNQCSRPSDSGVSVNSTTIDTSSSVKTDCDHFNHEVGNAVATIALPMQFSFQNQEAAMTGIQTNLNSLSANPVA